MKIKAEFKDVQNYYHSDAEKIILSNEETLNLNNKVFVLVTNEDENEELFNLQINCEFFCSIFRDVKIWNDYIVIGFDNYCYFFDYKTKAIFHHKLKSFFDNIYTTDNMVFICSASYINCFDSTGKFIWQSGKLGIESIKISKVENNVIEGSGNWDSPQGWVSFEVKLEDNSENQEKVTKTRSFLKSLKVRAKSSFQFLTV